MRSGWAEDSTFLFAPLTALRRGSGGAMDSAVVGNVLAAVEMVVKLLLPAALVVKELRQVSGMVFLLMELMSALHSFLSTVIVLIQF